MDPKYFEFGGGRVGGGRGGEDLYLRDIALASPLAMPHADFTFPSFGVCPLDNALALRDDPFATLSFSGPNSPASSTHSATIDPIPIPTLLPPDCKPLPEPGQDLGAIDLESLALPIEFSCAPDLAALFSPALVASEKVQFEYTAPQPHPQSAALTPAPSISNFSETEFSAASSPQGDPGVPPYDLTAEDLFEIVRSLDEELPPQVSAPTDTLALLSSEGIVYSSAVETIQSAVPLEPVFTSTQAAQSSGYGSVIVPNNLRAALPKASAETIVPTAIVITQQQLKELNLPDETLIVLKPDVGQFVLDLTSSDVALSLPQSSDAPIHDVFPSASAARQKATPALRQHVIGSSSHPHSPAAHYPERAALKRVRPRDESESEKSEGSDPTWTPDELLDYAAPTRPKRMAVRRFPNPNPDADEFDGYDYDYEYEAVNSWSGALSEQPLSPIASPQKTSPQKQSGGGGRSGRKSQAPQNRKERKRQQNREAAARYRQKKRSEHDGVEDSIEEIEQRNVDLRQIVERARRECEAFKKAARAIFGPSFDRLMAEARAKASAASASAHVLVHSKH